MSVSVRLVKPEEYEAVDELITAAYEHDYGVREPNEHEPQPDPATDIRFTRNRARLFQVWVAVDDESGEILGSITNSTPETEKLQEETPRDELDFRLLGVAPNARRRGIGKILTLHTIALARQYQYTRVNLKSAPNMLGAHRLYESLGFRRFPERDGLIINGEKVLDLFAFVIDVDNDDNEITIKTPLSKEGSA